MLSGRWVLLSLARRDPFVDFFSRSGDWRTFCNSRSILLVGVGEIIMEGGPTCLLREFRHQSLCPLQLRIWNIPNITIFELLSDDVLRSVLKLKLGIECRTIAEGMKTPTVFIPSATVRRPTSDTLSDTQHRPVYQSGGKVVEYWQKNSSRRTSRMSYSLASDAMSVRCLGHIRGSAVPDQINGKGRKGPTRKTMSSPSGHPDRPPAVLSAQPHCPTA